MEIRLVADSSANVYAMEGADFVSVPLKIVTEQQEYVDDVRLDVDGMIDQLRTVKGKTGTSCPNIHDWLKAFQGAKAVFAVTITSNLSGSYASAVQAAEEYEAANPGAKVCVIDSLSAGPELGLLLEQLRRWIGEDRDFDRIRQDILQYESHTHLIFSLESLTNLARNGRVNPAVAKLAGVLGIRVVGVASEMGTLEPLHKCRGEKKALEAMCREMLDRGYAGGRVKIAHCRNLQAALELKKLLQQAAPQAAVEIEHCGALCSFYAEQGGLLVGYEDRWAATI